MYLVFAGLVGSTFVVLLVWAGAMTYRLYNPERPRPFEEHPVIQRERATACGRPVPVGVEEIRADRRREMRTDAPRSGYVFGRSNGIPQNWEKDLWDRRN